MLPILVSLGPIKIYSFGVFLFLSLFVGLYWWWKMGRDEHYEEIELFDGYFISLVIFLVCSRAAYVSVNPDLQTWYRAFALLAYPGLYAGVGILSSLVYIIWYARMRQWETWKVLDMGVVALGVILTIGSVGALLNGSNPGIESAWGLVYAGESVKRLPVDLWTLLWSLITFGLVSRVRKEFRFFSWYKGEASVAKDGLAFLVFVFLAGIYLIVAGLIDDVWWKMGPVPGLSVAGAALLLSAGYAIYSRSGRNRGVNLLQWVSHIGKRR